MSSVSLYNIQKEKNNNNKSIKRTRNKSQKTRVTRTRNSNKFTENQKNQQKTNEPPKKNKFFNCAYRKSCQDPRRETNNDNGQRSEMIFVDKRQKIARKNYHKN